MDYQGKDVPAMHQPMHLKTHQTTGYLSRRLFLQSLAGFILTMSIDGCTQSITSSSTTVPTPTPRPYGSVISRYRGHTMRVTTVAWSPDGKYIASGSLDKTVQVWSANSSNHVRPFVYRGHSAAVRAVDWSPNSQRVVSGAEDTTVH